MEDLLIKTQTLSSSFFGSFDFIILNYSLLSFIPFNKLFSPVSIGFLPLSFTFFSPWEEGLLCD